MIYFQNKDPKKNIGMKTGQQFVVMFKISSYVLRKDGSEELVKENDENNFISLMLNSIIKDSDITMYRDKDSIVWN